MSDSGQQPGWWQAPDGRWYPPAPPEPRPTSPADAQVPPEPVGADVGRSVAVATTGSTSPNWSTVFAVVGCVMVVVLSSVIAYLLTSDGDRRATPPSTPPTVAVTPTPATTPPTAAPTTPPPTTQPATTQPATTPPATTGPPVPAEELTPTQRAAAQQARSLIAYYRTSRAATIARLTDENDFTVEDPYTIEDATIAVDSLGIDWNNTALRAASDELSVNSISRRGLFEKLTGPYTDSLGADGFTKPEATYALDNLDADWDFEAAQAAKRLLGAQTGSSEPPTCEYVINQLTDTQGFTSGQAQRGAQTAGAC